MASDDQVDWVTAHLPPAEISPSEFEGFVTELLASASSVVGDVVVTPHERVTSADGTYDFDTTVRFSLAGVQFLVIVEAKKHKNPVKRELVQVLYQKVLSTGAQKGVMISTAPYQRGAVDFALAHGIALATVTEGRFTFASRADGALAAFRWPTRDEASELGIPTFVGYRCGPGSQPDSVQETLLSPEYPEYVAEMLVGKPVSGT